MSDRIAVMNRGRVEQVGGPEEVYERPDDDLRRRLHRRLQPDAGDGHRRAGEVQLDQGPTIDAPRPTALGAGERCHAVVRPEKLRIDGSATTAGGPNGLPRVEGVVESSVYLGTATQIVGRPRRRRADDRARPERRRGRAPAAARRRRPGRARAGSPSTCTWSASRPTGAEPRSRRRRRPTVELETTKRGESDGSSEKRSGRVSLIARRWSRRSRWRSGSPPAAAAAGSKAAATRKRETVKLEGKPSGSLTISNWPLYIDKEHRPRLRKGDRRHGQVHRGRQRQRRVLRQDAAAARPGRIGRPQHLRRHRLDGEQDARARLPAELRQVGAAERRKEPRRRACAHPPFDPNRDYTVPWQSGMTGLIVNKEPGAGRALDLRPLRPASTRARSTCSPKCATRCRW